MTVNGNHLVPSSHVTTNGVGVLVKVDAILGLLEHRPMGAGPTEVADALGMTKSTAYRLLTSLESIGLVDGVPGAGRYKLGLRLLRLGQAVQGSLRLRDVAFPIMDRLMRETGLTVYLCVREGSEAVCIESLAGRQVDILELKPGGRLPGYAGGAGRVMLLGLDDDELDSYLAQAPFPRKTQHTLIDEANLRAAVETSRRAGYVVSREDVTIGIGAVASPVLDATGAVEGALSLAGLMTELERLGVERLGETVKAQALEVSRSLGYTPRSSEQV